jgi:hypothetical protein
MKNNIILLLYFLIFCNAIGSFSITIIDLYYDNYFADYQNLKSFKNKKSYMTDDFMHINRVYWDTGSGKGDSHSYDVDGVLLSNNSEIKFTILDEEYLNLNLDKQPLYRSKLTGMYFLKDAPERYYNGQIRGFYLNIYFKISFYIIIGIVIYLIIQHIKNRKYRL